MVNGALTFNVSSGSIVGEDFGSVAQPIELEDGSISVTARDGSSVTLEPSPNDDSQAVVTVSGVEGTQLVSWNDGFQVYCLAFRSDISSCQPE